MLRGQFEAGNEAEVYWRCDGEKCQEADFGTVRGFQE